MKPHYFLAIDIPEEIADMIYKWTLNIKKEWTFQNWVHREDYHMTLAFLGTIDDKQRIENLCKKLENVGKNISPFSLKVSHIGTFGREQFPRILWIGVEESDALHQLRKSVYNVCLECEFSLDPRPFKPHITVAKKWKGEDPIHIENGSDLFIKKEEFHVHSFKLFKTDVLRIPKYERILEFPLSEE